jgi:hypothetical protein
VVSEIPWSNRFLNGNHDRLRITVIDHFGVDFTNISLSRGPTDGNPHKAHGPFSQLLENSASSSMFFYVPQNAQNQVCYASCCDAEEGSNTQTCDRIPYHIYYLSIHVFKRLWTCDLIFSPSGDVNPYDIVCGGLRSSHMSGEGLSVISHGTTGTYI